MCRRCQDIDKTIDRYKRLKNQIADHQMYQAAEKLVLKLEAEKLALHPKA
jgi:hypothetical protein